MKTFEIPVSMDFYEAEKERKRKLHLDKRVKKIVYCDYCGASISKNKYEKNGGYCDNCIEAMY